MHKGHLHLLHELRACAHDWQGKPVVVTFSPHTLVVLRPELDVQCLTTLEEKLALAQSHGSIADSIVISFTPEMAAMSANDFMDSLCERFTIKGMVVGTDFSLGHKRMGDMNFLKHYTQEHHILLHPIVLEEDRQTRISSTRIRTLVSEGRIAEANDLLGHPVTFHGVVVQGDQRGRLLGFPTANLLPEAHKLLPTNGVYAARVHVGEMATNASDSASTFPVYNGVVNIGVRPTFNGNRRLLEAHLLDVEIDLYGQPITLAFIARLRSEQRFAGIDELKAQIALDVLQARQIFQGEEVQ